MIVCLCPTFRRPQLAGNAAACFIHQEVDYPRYLLVWEDGGALEPLETSILEVIVSERLPDLGTKYNRLAETAIRKWNAEYLAVWEDDDIYLPWYLRTHLEAIQQTGAAWSKPSRVYSTYTGRLQEEPAAGRFHGSLFLTRRAWEAVRWPENGRADFDQQLMAALTERFGPPADPLTICPYPGYVFRYGSTGAYHAQWFMRAPEDRTWYWAVESAAPPIKPHPLRIAFDEETIRIYSLMVGLCAPCETASGLTTATP